MQRLGVTNCSVINYDGRKLPNFIKGFDRILLDAPCTGLGVISRDPSIKSNRFLMDVRKNGHLQRELLRAAVDCCKPGGIIVYSTCSVSVEENEAVVDYITKVRHVKVRDTGLPIKKGGLVNYKEHRFNPKIALTRRVYPHVHNMDGFFIAKIQKIKDGEKKVAESAEVSKPVLSKKKGKKGKKGKKDKGPKKSKTQKKVVPETTEETTEEATTEANEGLTKKQKNKLATNLKKRQPQNESELAEITEVKASAVTGKKAYPSTKPVKGPSHKLAKKKKLLLLKRKKLAEIRKKKLAEKAAAEEKTE